MKIDTEVALIGLLIGAVIMAFLSGFGLGAFCGIKDGLRQQVYFMEASK